MDHVRNFGNLIKDGANTVKNKWENTSTTKKAVIIGSAAAVTAPLAIIPALGVVGFTSAGVAAGSIAASLQTATTVSGSLFALCQSAAATGVVATSTSIGVGLTAGATAGSFSAAIFRKSGSNQNDNVEEHFETEEKETQTEDFHTQTKTAETQTKKTPSKTKKTQTKTENKQMENKETQTENFHTQTKTAQTQTEKLQSKTKKTQTKTESKQMQNMETQTEEKQTESED